MTEQAITGTVLFSDGVELPVCWNGAGGREVVRFAIGGVEYAPDGRVAELESLVRDVYARALVVAEAFDREHFRKFLPGDPLFVEQVRGEFAGRMAALGIETESEGS